LSQRDLTADDAEIFSAHAAIASGNHFPRHLP
jgi:hypothetical protein